jgi:hypothetical protein
MRRVSAGPSSPPELLAPKYTTTYGWRLFEGDRPSMTTVHDALALALDALERGDITEAYSIGEQIRHAAPDHPDALYLIATIAERRGDLNCPVAGGLSPTPRPNGRRCCAAWVRLGTPGCSMQRR